MNYRIVKAEQKKTIYNFEVTPSYGYHGFQLYFTEKEPSNVEKIIKNIKSFESYIHKNLNLFSSTKIKQTLAFNVDLKRLLRDDEFNAEWIEFKDEIINDTEVCLNCMSLAVHQFLINEQKSTSVFNHLQIIRCRLINNEPVLQLKQLRVKYYDKLISLRGTVIKVGSLNLSSQYLAFRCSTCFGTQIVKQVDSTFATPTKCLSTGCRTKKNFKPLLTSPHSRTINSQMIKLQEVVGEEAEDNGRIPKTIECDLTEDLVNCCIPGDDIIITGIVKVRSSDELNFRSKQSSVFLLYLDVVSVLNERNASGQKKGCIQFKKQDYYAIDKIHSEPNLFRFLVHSLCPNIYGHEIVKAGLLLSLFGGTYCSNYNLRCDSHVLVVGDPGLGKSQMLKSCVNVAPRGVYVCGNNSTVAGLTTTMKKESGGDWALEAGALVLADQGTCCIDEFDKMSNQHACLLEAMEQQYISIAKAGVSCYLPARISVLAAANPTGGHYNKSKTVAENLKINSPLLSRFDLVFILLDKPDEEVDKLLSEHILSMSSGKKANITTTISETSTSTSINADDLKVRLRLQKDEEIDWLPHSLFRKYIAYAKKYVHPTLNKDAQKLLNGFYMDLRKTRTGDSTPVTRRQLESLKRLTQARAKSELREEATAEDARDVIEIMRASLIDVFSDEMGVLDFTRSQNGSGISKRKTVTNFVKVLERKAQALGRSTFSLPELKGVAEQQGIPKSNFNSIIDSLNLNGYILKKGGDKFQLSIVE